MISRISKGADNGAGIYIHVPFCLTKCPYCDFYSVSGTRQMAGFVRAVQVEARRRAYEVEGRAINTIYLGGGTPSLLTHIQVRSILETLREVYDIQPDAEITMECNPGDVSKIELSQHIESGVNRFSIGAQSFQLELLKTLGRRHLPEDTKRMYGYMRGLGVDNISLDLIYSIPNSTVSDLKRDLYELIALNPEHISTYDLIYEAGTPFYKAREEGKVLELPEEKSLEMSHLVRQTLTEAGYEHYEISNFARPGFRSRHNSSYWQGVPYIGLGPSAHSYQHPWRSWNEASLDEYNRQLLNGAGFLDRAFELITPEMQYEEYLLTRLRTSEGISIEEIKQIGADAPVAEINKLISEGLLAEHCDGRMSLTPTGIHYSDAIVLRLLISTKTM